MNCERFWELLATAALAQLPASVQAELDSHAAGCPDCAQALAAERLLSQALAPSRNLRPSRSLQEALLAVPRQAERGRRLRALGVFALPVSVLALGLLAFLAPELLRGQRTTLEEAQPADGPSAPDIDMAAATATTDLDRATVARPAGSPAAALAGGTRKVGAASPTPRSARRGPLAPGSAPARSVAPSAAPTASPSPQLAPAPPLRPQRPRPRPSATPAPPEAGDMGAGQSGPGPLPPLPQPPEPDPTDPADPQPTGKALVPGPQETATPESGPPGGGRGPETPTPAPSPEASRAKTPDPITATPTPGGGDPSQPIVPPSETPTPTPTPSPTPTTTP